MIVKKYLVSAIVSTYNSEKFIKEKLDDLLMQTIADKLEIIIVNSGSQQNEDKIIDMYLKKYSNIKYIKTEERETIYKAWNRGIKIAKGEFITNANTDDRLKNDAYEILTNFLLQNNEYALVYADQYLSTKENETFEEAKFNKVIKFPDYSHVYMLERCIIGSQPIWRSSLNFNDNFWFDEQYEVSGDHEFELRVSEKYKIYHLRKCLGVFYKSPNKTNKETENLERTREEVKKVTSRYINRFISSASIEELTRIKKKYRINLLIPILFYEAFIRLERITIKSIYPRLTKHSIEFIYYLNILVYQKFEDQERVLKLSKKYLRFKKSDRIKEKYLDLINAER
ncbi:MAG: glycosyltransferase [Ignavibacteriae bacterium]|nr:glycosyltransferase [Ignavibacteriota bacterium]